ncbi:MAG TPA: GerMN domain-containing protein [Acidimicrobiia bacterium]|nr:GerMN domain-containing protein [Acidimicrobiia bacterium]
MRVLITAIATVLTLSACAGETGETTTASSASTSIPAPTTTTTTTTTIPDTTSTTAEELGEVPAYFFFAGYPTDPGPWVVPVARAGEGLEMALTSLLKGVHVADAEMGLSSAIPENTRLLGVTVDDGVASIDLSREFESGGGSLSVLGRVAQVVYTATKFDEVEAVVFLIEGIRIDVLSGEGLILDEPQTREGYRDLIPAILVEEPLWGSAVGSQLTMSGLARTESGTINYTIVDAEGLIVAEGGIPTTPHEWSEFQTVVEISPTASSGLGSIVVFEMADDGSQRHVLEYPLEIGD